MEKDPLLQKKKLPTSKVLLAAVAQRRHAGQVKVQLTEKGLEQTHENTTRSIQFDFDIKFSFTHSPPEIKFESDTENIVYTLSSESQVNCWRQILKNKLNQRGFHEQFKPYKKIGKGNFATVFLVKKVENKTYYAVKAFSKEAAYSEEKGKECLIKEIQVMRALNHKNTMRLHEVFESENSLYIIFQLLEGGQLQQKIKNKYKFKHHEIVKVMKGILEGLREMHTKKVMHRDLKPENLLFRKEGDLDCVIADFGLAQFQDASEYLFVRCGTPGYVAPEVINIKDMSTKYHSICDLFSLGLIFHILLTGRSAFPGKNYNEVLAQNRASNIPLTGDLFKNVPPAAMDLLGKMLKKNPLERISAEDALKHKFFESEDVSDQEETYHMNSPVMNGGKQNYGQCDSPLLTSANPKRKQDKNIKKDSCVDFKMAKDNVMTGKTDTVNNVQTKISVFKASDKARKPKVSQFCAQKN